jgi:hypothetical protein
MSGDQYIQSVLATHEYKPGLFAAMVPGIIVPKLKQWAGNNLNEITYVGSVAKGTPISGATDLDIFISLKPSTPHTLEEIYNKLYQKAVAENWMPRQQNVSVGINYIGAQIDLVPGRLQEGFLYYHSLWKRKANTWTQSAPQIHITKVQQSGRLREIRAIKIWRKNHNLEPGILPRCGGLHRSSGHIACGADLLMQVILADMADAPSTR